MNSTTQGMTPEQVRELRVWATYWADDAPIKAKINALLDSWLLQQKVVDAAQRYLDVLKDPSSPPAVRQGAIDALAASLSPAASPDEGETNG